jgi:hypothetical protein
MVVFFFVLGCVRVWKLRKEKKKLSYVAVFVSSKEFFYARVGVVADFEIVVWYPADVARIDKDVKL